jgi:hypothetical protein
MRQRAIEFLRAESAPEIRRRFQEVALAWFRGPGGFHRIVRAGSPISRWVRGSYCASASRVTRTLPVMGESSSR